MKKSIWLICLFQATLFLGCDNTDNKIRLEYVDPLQKVFPESNYFAAADAKADAARGEDASFQFVVKGDAAIKNLEIKVKPLKKGDQVLSQIKSGFVEFVRIERSYSDPAVDHYVPVSGYYPDPIIYKNSTDIASGVAQPLWVSVKIPGNQEPGTYAGEIQITGKMDGKRFRRTSGMTIKVYKPIIEKTSLWVTNWFFDKLEYMNNGQTVEKYSDLYWQLWHVMAKMMREYRQNVAMISPLDLTTFKFANNQWSFDFSNFNRLVKLFADEGVIGRLEGGHFGSRLDDGWTSQFGLFVPVLKDNTYTNKILPLNNPETKQFYSAFLPALMQNLKNQGWMDNYIQHVADEPIDENVKSYMEISKFVRGLCPNIKIIEACHSNKLENEINTWVPQLNFLTDQIDFYKERQAKGDEVWFYTCMSPQGKFPNRFIDQPLIKTRLLHWINFKYGITGYLHWGYNHWGINDTNIPVVDNPFGETSVINGPSGYVLPGGDSWIVYPAFKILYPSIRLEAMRDGIVDYELLKMFKAKFPLEAEKMVQWTVSDMKHININTGIPDFRNKRRMILEKLSE